MVRKRNTIGLCLALTLTFGLAGTAHAKPASAAQVAEAKEMLKKSIGFRTVVGRGQMKPYAEYLASILKAGGFADSDIVITPMGDTATMTATYKGTTDAKPIVLLAHMDVVEAKPEDWERDPFTAVEENGFIYGRGSEDNKYGIVTLISTLVRLKAEGFKPKRDYVLVLTGDEETSMVTTRALAPQFKNAELVLNNDAGGGELDDTGKPTLYAYQAGEKSYADFQVSFTDPGGHSSTPTKTNPVYRLAKALDRVGAYDFPNQINELTKASLMSASKQIGGEIGAAMGRYAANPEDKAAANMIAARPEYVGQIRTTCTTTMVEAGHALNALPQRATASINCRIFPGVSVETVKAELTRLVADDSAKITVLDDPTSSDASPLRKDVTDAITKAVHARYPGLAITPSMSAGATDSIYFRALGIPSYGVSPLFMKPQDSFSHGLNERVPADMSGALQQMHVLLIEMGKK